MNNNTLKTSLSDYLWEAWEKNQAAYQPYCRPANQATYQPQPYGRPWRSPEWEFVRAARAHPDLAGLDLMDTLRTVESVLRSRFPKGDPWKQAFPASEDPVAEFADTWEQVRFPKPDLEVALQEAKSLPLLPSRCYSPHYGRFVSLVGHLQRLRDDEPIWLPCRKVGAVLETPPTTVSLYRRRAVTDGLMVLTTKHENQHLQRDRKADEFRFHCELFDWHTGKQVDSESLNICVQHDSKKRRSAGVAHRLSDTQDTQDTQENQG